MFISVEELISGRDAWSMPSVQLAPVDLTYLRNHPGIAFIFNLNRVTRDPADDRC